jgi:outer membrane lipoprotein-sorting protein
MTFGSKARLAASIVAVFFTVALAAVPAPARAQGIAEPAQAWTLARLMASLHQVRSATAHFVERKYMKMLSEPLETSGTLVYVAPDKLQKQTLEPMPELLQVDGDTITIEQGAGGTHRTLSINEYPQIGAFVEGIRAILAGDLSTLNRFYDVSLEGDAAEWHLLLQPKDQKLRDMVKSVRIAGSHDQIRRIETEEGDGDRSDMNVFEKVQ